MTGPLPMSWLEIAWSHVGRLDERRSLAVGRVREADAVGRRARAGCGCGRRRPSIGGAIRRCVWAELLQTGVESARRGRRRLRHAPTAAASSRKPAANPSRFARSRGEQARNRGPRAASGRRRQRVSDRSRGRRAGRLHRVHAGVYAAVAPELLSEDGHLMAAVLGAGDGALLSHGTAAWRWRIIAAPPSVIGVGGAGGASAPLAGRGGLQRSDNLRPGDSTHNGRFPTTTVARTLLDLATRYQPARVTQGARGGRVPTRPTVRRMSSARCAKATRAAPASAPR